MKPSYQFVFSAPVAVAAVALLSGCGAIQTFNRGKEALVKMPLEVKKDPKTRYETDEIIFQQAFAAPTMGRHHATWFLAWRRDERPILANRRQGLEDIAHAAQAAMHRYPILVEENFAFKATGRRMGIPEPLKGEPPPGEKEGGKIEAPASPVVLGKGPSGVWPYKMTKADIADWQRRHPGLPVPDFDPLWHLGDGYTQLRAARQEVGRPNVGERIRIGHLDNGFTAGHAAAPTHMMPDRWVANAPGLARAIQRGETSQHPSPGQTQGSHGTGTLGILAGGRVKMPSVTAGGKKIGGIDEAIGGAPEAEVLSVRVAPWVGSLSSAEMAYAIDLASRVHRCDVISMSHGGLPTVAWTDAINAAYERGTAIFAAESDYFSLVPRPLYPAAFIWPSSPVWPAAFRRVMGVTGVQKDGVTYAKNGGIPLTGFLRGSYGPDGARNYDIFSSSKGDRVTVFWGGRLRAHPIAAYAPNVVWPSVREDKATKKRYLDRLDFNGGGTSSATPQVAAAAALWLQKHRHNFPEGTWNTWRKPEAVYYALLKSAARKKPMKADRFLGAGILKAQDALRITPREAMAATKPPGTPDDQQVDLCFPRRVKNGRDFGMASDYADGERSFKAFIGFLLGDPTRVPVGDRKNLNEKSHPGESFEEAMMRIRENDELIRKWRDGRLPREDKKNA